MSGAIRALREAEDALTFLGLDPSEAHRDALTKHMLEITFASVLEFGADSIHPTAVDAGTEYGTLITDKKT